MPFFPALPQLSSIRATALILGMLACGATTSALANNLDEASQLIRSGQHAKALDEVNQYLAGKPRDPQGRFLKGIIYTGMNKTDEALAIFKKLTEDYPELPEPYNNLAVIYAQQKQYEKAKEALEKAIRTHPAYATAHENLGDIYTRLASQAYGKALQFNSANTSAQTKLAMINDLVGSAKGGAGGTAAAPVKPPAPVLVARVDDKPAEPPIAPKPPPVTPAKPAETKPAETKPAETKPVETKPEPPRPATTAPAPGAPKAEPARSAEAEITAAVDGWLTAWSNKNVKAYLAHYAADFQVPGGKPRKSWENERAARIDKPGKIEVSRDRLSIKEEGADKVIVRFRQHYRSAGFNSSASKTLVLVRREGHWLIQQEQAGG